MPDSRPIAEVPVGDRAQAVPPGFNGVLDPREGVRRIGPDEELISLAEAARHLPRIDGRKVNIATIWRWARHGLRGVFLEYVRAGRRICTTRQALLRFFTALAALDQRVSPDQYYKPPFRARRGGEHLAKPGT